MQHYLYLLEWLFFFEFLSSFLNSVLGVQNIILFPVYRFNDFGVDGGPAARALRPKFNAVAKHVVSHTGFKVPPVEVSYHFSITTCKSKISI